MLVALAAASTLQAADTEIKDWRHAGQNGDKYEMVLDSEVVHEGHASARITCPAKHCPGFGTLSQVVRAGDYVGARVQLTAWVKGKDAGRARLWMRFDGPSGEIIQFDNMEQRGKHGTFDWVEMRIVLDAYPPVTLLTYGVMLSGKGQVWADDFRLETIKVRGSSTNTLFAPMVPPRANPESAMKAHSQALPAPSNLDFEEQP